MAVDGLEAKDLALAERTKHRPTLLVAAGGLVGQVVQEFTLPRPGAKLMVWLVDLVIWAAEAQQERRQAREVREEGSSR